MQVISLRNCTKVWYNKREGHAVASTQKNFVALPTKDFMRSDLTAPLFAFTTTSILLAILVPGTSGPTVANVDDDDDEDDVDETATTSSPLPSFNANLEMPAACARTASWIQLLTSTISRPSKIQEYVRRGWSTFNCKASRSLSCNLTSTSNSRMAARPVKSPLSWPPPSLGFLR